MSGNIAFLKVAAILTLYFGLLVSFYYWQTARIAAVSAAAAGVTAASNVLVGTDSHGDQWDCTDGHDLWDVAEDVAIHSVIQRIDSLQNVVATGVQLRVTSQCVVGITVTTITKGIHSVLSASAVSCDVPSADPLSLSAFAAEGDCSSFSI